MLTDNQLREKIKYFLKEYPVIKEDDPKSKAVTKKQMIKSFNTYNLKFFDNKINADVEISSRPFRSSFVLGFYATGENKIYINKNKFPIELLDLVLLHEMVHAYNVQVEGLDPATDDIHGALFMRKVKELNAYLKYPIPYKEDLASFETVLDALGL